MAGEFDTFSGGSITLGTTGQTLNIIEGGRSGLSVEMYRTSHAGTTNQHTKKPSKLRDGGEFTFTVYFDPDTDEETYVGVQQTITVTTPVPSGLTNGATRQFTGTVSEFGCTLPLEEAMTAEITISVDDEVTQADAS